MELIQRNSKNKTHKRDLSLDPLVEAKDQTKISYLNLLYFLLAILTVIYFSLRSDNNLSIVIRHGNRYPTLAIPVLEKIRPLLDDNLETGPLTELGLENSVKIGQEIYQKFSYTFVPKILTSPVYRCKQTAANLIKGMNGNAIISYEVFDGLSYYPIKKIMSQMEEDPVLIKLAQKLRPFRLRLIEMTQIKSNTGLVHELMDIFDIHSSLICYKEFGYDISQFDPVWEELEDGAKEIVYTIKKQMVKRSDGKELAHQILSKLQDQGNTVAVTHDAIMHLLFAHVNNLNGHSVTLEEFKLGPYLSYIEIHNDRFYYLGQFVGHVEV